MSLFTTFPFSDMPSLSPVFTFGQQVYPHDQRYEISINNLNKNEPRKFYPKFLMNW